MTKKVKLDISATEALERADILLDQGEEDAGEQYLKMVVEGGKKNAEVLFEYAVAVEDQRQYNAVRFYKEALKLDPKHAEAHYGLGRRFGCLGNLDEAIKHFKKAIKIAPEDAKAYCGLGLALSKQGKQKKALKNIRKALKLEPEDSVDYRVYAMICENLGDKKEALKQLRKSERMKKDVQVEYEIAKLKALVEDKSEQKE